MSDLDLIELHIPTGVSDFTNGLDFARLNEYHRDIEDFDSLIEESNDFDKCGILLVFVEQ